MLELKMQLFIRFKITTFTSSKLWRRKPSSDEAGISIDHLLNESHYLIYVARYVFNQVRVNI